MCTVLGFAHRKLSGWFQHNPGRLSLRNKASRSANGRHWNGALTDKIKQCCKQTLVIATVGEMEARACFEALPNEILFHIFASLDARFVVDVVARVCRRFALVLSDSSFWKAKLFHRWPKPYPVTPGWFRLFIGAAIVLNVPVRLPQRRVLAINFVGRPDRFR